MRTYVPAFVLAVIFFVASLALGLNAHLFLIGCFYIGLLIALVALPEPGLREFLDTDWSKRREDVP